MRHQGISFAPSSSLWSSKNNFRILQELPELLKSTICLYVDFYKKEGNDDGVCYSNNMYIAAKVLCFKFIPINRQKADIVTYVHTVFHEKNCS